MAVLSPPQVYDVIGVLTTVHRWAFSTRGWHLRMDGSHLDGQPSPLVSPHAMPGPRAPKPTCSSGGTLGRGRSHGHHTIDTCGDSAGAHPRRSAPAATPAYSGAQFIQTMA